MGMENEQVCYQSNLSRDASCSFLSLALRSHIGHWTAVRKTEKREFLSAKVAHLLPIVIAIVARRIGEQAEYILERLV